MRYSLLNYVVCPHCHGELVAITEREIPGPVPEAILAPCARVSPEGARVGPVPHWRTPTALGERLAAHASMAAPPGRNFQVVVDSGLLVCAECGRWYPIRKAIPELLPDGLRQWDKDRAHLDAVSAVVPRDVLSHLRAEAPEETASGDGAHHKLAEIALPSKVEDAGFFGPGYTAPFNMGNPEHSWYLIRLFSLTVSMLDLEVGDVVLDTGCGYSWTTEWLHKSGHEAIGIDLAREYLEIGLTRIGSFRPHLVVGDVENLPLRDACLQAVLGYEAFHHIPDRRRAMAGFARVLKPGRPVVLAEPGAEHEHAAVSIEVMEKYGTLEKGMELPDVAQYVAGTGLTPPEQQWVVRVTERDLAAHAFQPAAIKAQTVIPGNLFITRKPAAEADPATTAAPEAARPGFVKRVVWPRLRRRAKAALVKIGLE